MKKISAEALNCTTIDEKRKKSINSRSDIMILKSSRQNRNELFHALTTSCNWLASRSGAPFRDWLAGVCPLAYKSPHRHFSSPHHSFQEGYQCLDGRFDQLHHFWQLFLVAKVCHRQHLFPQVFNHHLGPWSTNSQFHRRRLWSHPASADASCSGFHYLTVAATARSLYWCCLPWGSKSRRLSRMCHKSPPFPKFKPFSSCQRSCQLLVPAFF